jgi:hypothetical protein
MIGRLATVSLLLPPPTAYTACTLRRFQEYLM